MSKPNDSRGGAIAIRGLLVQTIVALARHHKSGPEAAEKLINDCGYHRRDEELADAKRAILGA